MSLNSFSQVEEKPEQKVSLREYKRQAKALWYYQKVDQYALTSKYIKRLQERLEKNQIIGLELVIAAPTDSAIESRWGHSMMRFVDNIRTPADDVMFGFVAEIDDLKLNYIKGILGGYPTYPALQSLRLFNQQYIKDQDRPLERIIVPSTALLRRQMVEKLVQEWTEIEVKNRDYYEREITQSLAKIRKVRALKKYQKTTYEVLKTDSGLIYAFVLSSGDEVVYTEPVFFKSATSKDLGGYTFLSNNCAGALIHFLQDLKLISKKSLGVDGRLPVNLPEYFALNGLSYLPKVIIPGIYDLKLKILKILNLSIDDLYNFEKWPAGAGAEFVKKLSLKEKLILLDTYPLFPDEVIAEINKSLPPKEARPNYEDTYGIVSIDSIAYTACQNADCAQAQIIAVNANMNMLQTNLQTVRLNQKRLSSENYSWINQHYNSYNQLLNKTGENL